MHRGDAKFGPAGHQIEAVGDSVPEVFENLGCPIDLDENGKPVRRPAGISQEHLQRAKSLSHENQKKLRRKRKDETTRKQQNKLVEEKLRILHILEDNWLCEGTVLELLGGPQRSTLVQAKLNSSTVKDVS